MYYYPYLLHFINLLTFRHHNYLDTSNNTIDKSIDLWSISRWNYTGYRGTKTFTASYNYYTQNYEFNEKKIYIV